ncbi:MAG TPA: hypothetical protein VJ777_01565, partial [Mycobacterium sp.]|nr:hypothetical protein [Mycobacterium sp.]
MLPAPPVDTRTSDDVVRQLLQLFHCYSGDASHPDQGASRALVEIFGRYAELIIERLNQVPNKNLLAFLDLIGASLLPPQPARVPLTFSLADGSVVDGLVPARTQVASVSTDSDTAPVVFETEEELVVTAAQLLSLFVRRPDQDKYSDYKTQINSISANAVPLFQGNPAVEHILYLANDSLFSDPGLTDLTLTVTEKANVTPSPLNVTWEAWNGTDWTSLNVTDATAGLTKTGDVTLKIQSPLVHNLVDGRNRCWLRCRLQTPIPPATYGPAGKLPELMP